MDRHDATSSRARRRIGVLTCAALALAGSSLLASPASADTAPVPPQTTPTVAADALPTVQVNGVVWDQVVVGNRVYATGQFSSARPAGAAAGTSETARSNILAYDLASGALVTSWAPTLNAQGLAIAASTDGTRVYVGGDFTSVSGVARGRIAALDATTGALVTSFAATVGARVKDLAVGGTTVYAGGSFTTAAGQARPRLAAFTAAGALTTWAPVADAEVAALVAPPGSGKVVVGGRFRTLNGVDAYGMGAVDATTGQTLPWAANAVVRNAGPYASINSLSTDGTRVFGTGYTYLVEPGSQDDGNFEATFAADVSTGELSWVSGCRGDTYGAAPVAGVLYSVGHPHDCAMIGGHPQTEPWTFQHAMAQTTGPDPGGAVNTSGAFGGRPAPQLLHWLPTLSIGSYTGQSQAAWTVTGNSQYVVLGGEFPRVNGINQQGLVRFAVTGIAPNKEGPQGSTDLRPTLVSLAPGTVRVAWKSAWDRDNRRLTYEVLRGATAATATVLATRTGDSTWWSRPPQAVTDAGAAPGTTQTYRVRVKDPFGNTVTSSATAITVPGGTAAPSAYRNAVNADEPVTRWPLGEASGTTGYDWIGADDLVLDPSATRGAAGPLLNEATTATTCAGSAAVPARNTTAAPAPQTFSVEAWIRTTTTSGGKIIGYGDSPTGNSGNYDRHLYLTDAGAVVFGVHPGGVRTVSSGPGLNDGRWHHLVGTLGSAGQELWVDGKRVGRSTDTTSAQPMTGYWRVGGDSLGGWPDQPASYALAGDVAQVATYPTALAAARIQAHFTASGRELVVPVRPSDAYGAAVWDARPDLYWRLDETTGTAAVDTMTAEPGAVYSAGVTQGQPGSPAAPAGRSATLPGGPETVVATASTSNPQVYSMEFWFTTSTTTGGRLMGFGSSPSGGPSSSYDRHVYMFDDGRLRYGVWTGQTQVVDTAQSYNDGAWHHVVATLGGDGQKLYVDGGLAGSIANTFALGYDGYWRLGSDNTWGGSSTNDFVGTLDEVAVYPAVLSPTAVQQHWSIGSGTVPNQPPTAAFTSTVDNLTVSVDGSGSTDADGSVASYAWDFGDDGTATGATAQHTYAAAGTYSVTLTVTDDDGGTDPQVSSVTVTAPPVPNTPPTAAFTSTTNVLTASFSAAGSTDADGTVTGYAWQFGDGGTGTGAAPQHPYAAAGTYPVTLTVTDDDGATGSVTHDVTVTAPPADLAARDTFSRTVASGLGTAETGGAWTASGTGVTSSVADGSARVSVPASRTAKVRLSTVAVQDVDVNHSVSMEAAATGGGTYLTTLVRTSSAGEYGAKVRVQSTGRVGLQLTRYVGGAETVLGTEVTVPGITYTPGGRLMVRVQAVGSAPTTLRARVWADGGTEPATWLQSVTDGTAGLQGAGGIGFGPYVSGSATTTSVIRYDELTATRL